MDVEIQSLDREAMNAARAELDRKTKPRGSLGRLEELAVQLAGIGVSGPRCAIVVAAADHGYADDDVSAYPAEVTRQMLQVFASGGAAISVLSRLVGAELVVVDAGVREKLDDRRVRSIRIGAGTANAAHGPAMSREQALAALDAGISLALPLLRASLALLAEMATFEDAGVTDAGR
jgi:nicotinate-nucleotide--dimethylbenzimidazole phosphoribosyltransferase